ncbi:hypothetical protein ACIBCM_30245 [Streptomyces sp. NPDC051018]|uniref:hypothetical protein n=1 Tax=Streptomyces sp. NPDC051018 TaxID=3365639 RepID=UPI0037B891EC
MSSRSAMRRLRDDLAHAVELAGPATPREVFATLCGRLCEHRGRPVELHLVEFPPHTASGLYLDMADRDIICVQASTHPFHQLVIFGHEVWHMVAGHSGHHAPPPAPPGPSAHPVQTAPADHGRPGGRKPRTAVQIPAARTDFRQTEEAEAETFGLQLGNRLRKWLNGTAPAEPRSGVARRIHTSLGHPYRG